LNAGRPTSVGYDDVIAGFDAFIGVDDERVGICTRGLAHAGVLAGPTGTAGLVGLNEAQPELAGRGYRNVLLVNTGGGADPTGYAQGLQAASVELATSSR